MNSSRYIILVSLFFIDVRVRAESVQAECWGKQIPCAVEARSRKVLSHENPVLVAGPGTLVHQKDPSTVQVVRGHVYFSGKQLRLSSPFAEVHCSTNCQMLIEREPTSITIKVLEGEAVLARTGDKTEYSVRAGHQLQVGEVMSDGKAKMEFPQSLPWDGTVKQWAMLFPGTFENFKSTLIQFRETWSEGVESASHLHLEYAGRALASHEQSLARQRARQAAIERENESLRRLFREKNHLNP